jgi:hypothetical protein
MTKPIASLSLDLDNKWSYLKTHGDPGWEEFPSYLDVVVPRILDFCRARDLTITIFVVGQDAALTRNHAALAALSAAGHEIGNHSFHHEPWLHLYSESEIDSELMQAEEHIERATGERPIGFRGPGFSLSDATLRVLAQRGYQYDASTFPTFLGPLARAYYFLTANLTDEEKVERKQLFGKLSEGFRPLRPYAWKLAGHQDQPLIEIPVTTMPIFKVPIHASYLLYLGQFSSALALAYFRWSLLLCRLCRVAPSMLLHPLDFLGVDDDADLAFFPAMRVESSQKIAIVGEVIDLMQSHYDIVTMIQHARGVGAAAATPIPLVSY